MPIIKTKGAASSQGFGEFTTTVTPVVSPNYVEDVFSTYLYTGNGSTQTISNGINLATYGGLVWGKSRTTANSHNLYDTARGASNRLASNLTNAQANTSPAFASFNSNGFSLNGSSDINANSDSIVSWTFREQAKFFDVVTYTGVGSTTTIAHNLGSTPGCVMIKRTDAGGDDWFVYHRSLATNEYLNLNNAFGVSSAPSIISVNSSSFTIAGYNITNASGGTYVAYLFAHDAGGFGLTGTDNVISCGSYTGNGSATGPIVTLGYEPQWILMRKASGGMGIASSSWVIFDTMRGIATISSGSNPVLYPNLTDVEDAYGASVFINVSATGFNMVGPFDLTNANSSNYIYIAIRRGPMKVPTSGAGVFSSITNSNGTGSTQTTGFRVDAQIEALRSGSSLNSLFVDRLRSVSTNSTGSGNYLISSDDYAESSSTYLTTQAWNNTGFQTPSVYGGSSAVYWSFQRAPGFFDEICYTGTGTNLSVPHNLGVTPELIIIKCRSAAGANAEWMVPCVYYPGGGLGIALLLSTAEGLDTGARGGINSASSTAVNVPQFPRYCGLGSTYVGYLFATCAGVSKVGSYTGTGALLTVNCGFTTGARFVLIKRTDTSGNWYVYDSARGLSASDDPYLTLDTTAAEVTGTNYVDTDTTGFKVTAAAPVGLNASGGTYIFLAIA